MPAKKYKTKCQATKAFRKQCKAWKKRNKKKMLLYEAVTRNHRQELQNERRRKAREENSAEYQKYLQDKRDYRQRKREERKEFLDSMTDDQREQFLAAELRAKKAKEIAKAIKAEEQKEAEYLQLIVIKESRRLEGQAYRLSVDRAIARVKTFRYKRIDRSRPIPYIQRCLMASIEYQEAKANCLSTQILKVA